MKISIDIVEWNEAEKKAKAGTLEDELLDIEGGEDWIEVSRKWNNESFIYYCAIGESLDRIKNSLSKKNYDACDKSLSMFLNETSIMPRELGEALDDEYYIGAMSPETISKIIDYYSKIDLNQLSKVLEQEAIEYIEEWISVFNESIAVNRGLLVHVG